MTQSLSDNGGRQPLILTVPGLGGSGPMHWQTLWEHARADTARVELGMWDHPHRNSWVTKLDQAVRTADAPIIVAAHSLGCLAVAWWAQLAGQPWGAPVAGAFLVAPPDVDHIDAHPLLRGFAPSPRFLLPFPSILVASEDDPYCAMQHAFDLAREWGSEFVSVGPGGHLNADSGLGLWSEGQDILQRLIGAVESPAAPSGPAARLAGAQAIRRRDQPGP